MFRYFNAYLRLLKQTSVNIFFGQEMNWSVEMEIYIPNETPKFAIEILIFVLTYLVER